MDSVVRDITLCPSGEKKIEWVRRNMPLLNAIRADFEREKPFLGLTRRPIFAGCCRRGAPT